MNSIKWILSILAAILIWPIVFIGLVIILELLMTIGLIVVLAYYIKAGIDA
jgi:hypothetical protein